jgi:hypothetical protein
MADQRGRDYSVPVQGVAVSAAQDIYEIIPADDKPIKQVGLEIGQSTEVGDAAEEGLRIAIRRGDTVTGSGGSAPTVRAPDPHDAAAGFTAEANNTTKANTSGVVIAATAWNIRIVPQQWWWPDNFPVGADQGNSRMCDELVAAPADAVTADHTAWIREF